MYYVFFSPSLFQWLGFRACMIFWYSKVDYNGLGLQASSNSKQSYQPCFPVKAQGNPILQLKLGLCPTHFTIHIVCRLYRKKQAYAKFDSTAGKDQVRYIKKQKQQKKPQTFPENYEIVFVLSAIKCSSISKVCE